jgi:hypothetical protein
MLYMDVLPQLRRPAGGSWMVNITPPTVIKAFHHVAARGYILLNKDGS